MINPQELRLGNYVLEHNHIIKIVTGITHHSVICRTVQDVHCQDDELLFKYISPIQLTKNWLEKFGCTSYENDFEETGDSIRLESGEVIRLDIQYIHQLQNAVFALTKQELPII